MTFTMIAGLLNILVILDAIEGPAYGYGDLPADGIRRPVRPRCRPKGLRSDRRPWSFPCPTASLRNDRNEMNQHGCVEANAHRILGIEHVVPFRACQRDARRLVSFAAGSGGQPGLQCDSLRVTAADFAAFRGLFLTIIVSMAVVFAVLCLLSWNL